MQRHQVESSLITSLGYDPHVLELEIEFKDGSVHTYQGVQPHVHAELVGAPSIGSAFHKLIRGKYDSRKHP